jgi:hypothetical protein
METAENSKQSTEIICESCGENFACGAKSEKCWCFGLELNSETLAKLKLDFQSCLCRQCLEKIQPPNLALTGKAITTNEL